MTDVRYRPEIDGLRAIAVAAVVLYHAGPDLLPGGFVGVDVFFVISGYLITSILVQERSRTGRISLLDFYARRMRRLLPALTVVLAAILAAAALLLPTLGRFQAFAESALASVLFVANFHFGWATGGYFDDAAHRQPLLHLWSLAVEEQFYVVYPLLLIGLFRLPWGRPVFILGLLSLASLLLAEYWLGVSRESAFYQMPARFWELAAGAMVALGPKGTLKETRASVQAGLGLLAIAGAAWLLQQADRFPGLGALAPVAGSALILHAVHGSARLGAVGRLLSLRPVVLLGLISYPLYLWHWPILVLDQATRLAPAGLAWRLLLCGVATVLAWLTYRFAEMPLRAARGVPSVRVIRHGLLSSAAMLVVILWLTTVSLDPDGTQLVSRTRADRPSGIATCHFDLSDEITALAPEGCRSDPSVEPRVAIWGDSHALAWKALAWDLAEQAGLSAEAHTMDACPPIPGFRGRVPEAPRFTQNCSAFNDLVRARIETGQYDLVVIVARWPAHLGLPLWSVEERRRAPGIAAEPPSPESVARGLRATIGMASRHARRVIVLGPTPVLHFDAPDCLATGRLAECAMVRSEFESRVAPVWAVLQAGAAGYANVQLIDPTGFFCPGTQCPVTRDGYGLFWDDDHVSSTAARAFARELAAEPGRFDRRAGAPPSSPPESP